MIESKDLRIGNLFNYHQFGVVPICGYRQKDVAYVTVLDATHLAGLKELQPIPITEEWLLKFGFDPDNDLKHPDAPIYFTDVRGELICFVHNCSHRRIKHVHQLQNLFHALTGEYLTIKENTPCKQD